MILSLATQRRRAMDVFKNNLKTFSFHVSLFCPVLPFCPRSENLKKDVRDRSNSKLRSPSQ